TPMKASFLPVTLETVNLLNEKTGKRGYYAFPMKRQTMHIQYWKDMLAEAGFKESDIPKTWNAYWDFWCTKAQAGYRKKSGQRIYSVGAPMGVDSSDSFYSFLTYMDAYNVKVVDDNGKLTVDRPEVKKGLVATVKDYAHTVDAGCTPPSAVNWKDPHRNIVHEQFSAGTVPFEFTKNYKFTILNNENVWAKAVNRVVVDKWTPEKAVDEMIARIKQVAG